MWIHRSASIVTFKLGSLTYNSSAGITSIIKTSKIYTIDSADICKYFFTKSEPGHGGRE